MCWSVKEQYSPELQWSRGIKYIKIVVEYSILSSYFPLPAVVASNEHAE